MFRTALRSALLVLVFVGLCAIGGTATAQTQAPAQAPAAAKYPTPPPAPADVAAAPANAQKTASGLEWKLLKPGTGTAHPGATDRVHIHYNAWTSAGTVVDSCDMRGRPSILPINGLMPGMIEAVQLLTVGGKGRFWVPEKLAFNGATNMPKGTIVFDIELLTDMSVAPPPDVAAPPADAGKTASGLASKVILAGTGKTHPTPESTVVFNYVGWTPDGKSFDAGELHPDPQARTRGGDMMYPLGKLIPGWIEGMQQMVEGEYRRFWIPGNLAYDNLNRPEAPKGMLIFDVVLVKIQ